MPKGKPWDAATEQRLEELMEELPHVTDADWEALAAQLPGGSRTGKATQCRATRLGLWVKIARKRAGHGWRAVLQPAAGRGVERNAPRAKRAAGSMTSPAASPCEPPRKQRATTAVAKVGIAKDLVADPRLSATLRTTATCA